MKKMVISLGILVLLLVGCGLDRKTFASKTTETTTVSTIDLADDETFYNEAIKTLPAVDKDNYEPDNYNYYNYKDLLRDAKSYKGVKISVPNLTIFQLLEAGKYTQVLASTPNSDTYMLIIETTRLETKLLKGDSLTINGQFIYGDSYIAKSGDTNEVPLIYVNAYNLNN